MCEIQVSSTIRCTIRNTDLEKQRFRAIKAYNLFSFKLRSFDIKLEPSAAKIRCSILNPRMYRQTHTLTVVHGDLMDRPPLPGFY